MKYWTIQHKRVLEILGRTGTYYPDFSLSPQTHKTTYDRLLSVFNQVNGASFDGLIFYFAKDPRQAKDSCFTSVDDFKTYFRARPRVLNAINNGDFKLLDAEHLLCEIETDVFDGMDRCPLDFWNFVMMMPDDTGSTECMYEMLRPRFPKLAEVDYGQFMECGWILMSHHLTMIPLMSSTVFQAHVPYLEKSMLKAVYSLDGLV